MIVRRQCIISDSKTDSNHSEDLNNKFPWNGRNTNDFICADVLPSRFESYVGTDCRLTKMLTQQHHRESDIVRNVSLNLQGGKPNDHPGLNSELGQRLTLSLNSRFSADTSSNVSQHNECDQRIQIRDIGEYKKNNRTSQDSFGSCVEKSSYFISADMSSLNNVLQNSRYLLPAQQLLDEVVCVSNIVEHESLNPLNIVCGTRALQPELLTFWGTEAHCLKGSSKTKSHSRITKLLALLKELECQYEKYCDRMNGVISSFESIAGTGAAKSYITLTIRAMSLHFLNLQEAIITQLQFSKSPSLDLSRNNILKLSLSDENHKKDLSKIPLRQVWRPPRGLPENSVIILRTWLFEHFLDPYPNVDEKLMLSSKTGLTKNQISNWFINARVRLWKPMIEQMYRKEFAEVPNDSQRSVHIQKMQ